MSRMPEETLGRPLLEMVEPLAGFHDHRSFTLVGLDDDGTISQLQATDRADLSFLVVSPGLFFPDYAPFIDDAVRIALDIQEPDELVLLLLVHPGATLADTTANLLAPVVVNARTGRAAQVVVADWSLPLRAPLAAA
jgi:flagellar assembly factor FliW